MGSNQNLPFKVGELAESKSFQIGYRGAWFRCKIRDIRKIKGYINYALEFFDFPDEKVGWTKLYQREEKTLHLMVRPSFPSFYPESEMPDTSAISEEIAVVDDVWKVGDLVDWWTDGCYWSGRITHLLGEDIVKIKLPDPPVGEGLNYEVACKDLRPSLDWSPERGWTVPISWGSEACHACARLVQPTNQETGINIDPSKEGASWEFRATSVSSHGSAETSPPPKEPSYSPKGTPKQLSGCGINKEAQRPRASKALDMSDVSKAKPSSSGSISSAYVKCVSDAAEKPAVTIGLYDNDGPPKKMRITGADFLRSSFSDTLESSILDLEELVNKVKWIKRVHQFGLQYANTMTSSWQFLEDRASFTRR